MRLLEDLLTGLLDGEVLDVSIGLHWTAVVVQVDGERRCGLASTVPTGYHHAPESMIEQAGRLHTRPALELARLALSEQPHLTAIGIAAINALLTPQPELWEDLNAEEVIATQGADKTVALIGSFPFVPRLRPRVGRLFVLELDPGEDELPADAAPDILPQADIVALTSMTLVNRTAESLLSLCGSQAQVLLLGPTTPLSPRLFEHGIHVLSGSVVTDEARVLAAVRQGAIFRQIHRAGVRLVTLRRER